MSHSLFPAKTVIVIVRFVRRPTGCNVSLSISYEVPEVLAPFANVSTV